MKNKKQFLFLSFTILILGLSVSGSIIFAQNDLSDDNIQYPIAELGNCENKDNCKKYCDNQQNFDACISFAEKNNLMPREEIETAKKFMAGGGKGPGGCKNKNECETYCDNIDNINECVSFAEKNNILSPKELEEAKKVKAAIEKGIKPPACRNKKQCDLYCSSADHMEECINFAEAAGFIPPEELNDAKKVLEAVKKGIKPPACRGKAECNIYCSEESHFEECINFAEAAGFIPLNELEMVRKTRGKGPGGCKGRDECDSFCQKEENMETCANFAMEHGLMKPEEFEMFKKTGGKGPGNCRGKKECESFCNNPDNQETCFQFAKEHNLIPPEEMEKMKEGMGQMKENLRMAPPEISECLKSNVGEEVLNKIQSGTFAPSRDLGEKMRNCFEQFMPQGQGEGQGEGQGRPMRPFRENEGGQGRSSGEFSSGPGGCKNQEECVAYCKDHPQDCGGGGFPRGGPPAGQSGQGGDGFPGEHRDFNGPRNTEECVKQGGSWDGNKCNFRDSTMENIGVNRGGEECVKQGGNWDGKNCNFSQQQYQREFQQQYQQQYDQQYQQMMPPPPSSMNKQNPFAQILYFFTQLLAK